MPQKHNVLTVRDNNDKPGKQAGRGGAAESRPAGAADRRRRSGRARPGRGGAALSRGLASAPAAGAATTTFTPVEPSGDTSGATDWNAIQSVLNVGQEAAAWLAPGTFYVNQTITFKSSQQAIRGQGRRVTTIVAVNGLRGTQTGTTTLSNGTTVPTTAVIYTGAGHQFLIVDGLTIQGPSGGSLAQSSTTGQLNGLQQTGGSIRCEFTNLHFLALNGWPFSFDGQGGNNAGMLVANALADNIGDDRRVLLRPQLDRDGERARP